LIGVDISNLSFLSFISAKKSNKHADPASDDHLQQIPRRLRDIMKSKEMMKQGSKKKGKGAYTTFTKYIRMEGWQIKMNI